MSSLELGLYSLHDWQRSRGGPKFGFAELWPKYSAEWPKYSAKYFGSTRLRNVVLFRRTSVLFGVVFLPRTTSYITTFHAFYFSTLRILRTLE